MSALSMGFWWNFGADDDFYDCKRRVTYAFDHGITTFDLANNYGPPYGAGEETFGRIMHESLYPYRREMIITTKAGHDMWPGPYGDGSSRKMLMTSIDDSLRRMRLEYVDIFYSHRYDGITPIEETMQALVDIVRSGKALYVGLSKYPTDKLRQALAYLADAHVPCLIYQDKSNMLVDNLNDERRDLLTMYGVGYTAFSPLERGLLSDKYLNGIPADSRAALGKYFNKEVITESMLSRLKRLNDIAALRGQSLSQMAVAWLLRKPMVSSVIIGPRTHKQMVDLLGAVDSPVFDDEEVAVITDILQS